MDRSDRFPHVPGVASALTFWEWSVAFHVYWPKKEEFQLEEDRYEQWCLFAVESGEFEFEIGDARGTAGSGDLVLCPPNVPFRRRVVRPPLSFHFIRMSRIGPNGEPIRDSNGDEAAVLESRLCGLLPSAGRARLLDTLDKCRSIGQLPPSDRDRLLSHYINDLWKSVWLERQLAESADMRPFVHDETMALAAERIRQRCGEPFSINALADELGFSPVQLIRRFRAAFGTTPGDYLTALRLERACRLLRETRMTIDQIASSCGYATGYYLSRLFAARIGTTPSEYRRRHRI